MTTIDEKPLFLTNEEWYITPEDDMWFEDGRGYHLADNVPQEVVDSYNEFYAEKIFDIELNGKSEKIRLI